MNCVILQPSYIPWRGYFHQIYKADVFVFYDDVQYDKNGWRNRNRIKTPNGSHWLTIPVLHRGNVTGGIEIKEIQIDNSKDWARKHWMTLQQAYSKAPFFDRYAQLLQPFFNHPGDSLADLTIRLTVMLADALGIHKTQYFRSSSLGCSGTKTDRLVEILKKLGATHYISGPAAKDYLEAEKLTAAGISLEWMVYDYPAYPQLFPPFDAQLSIVDLLFMVGPESSQYIWEVD